MASYQTAIMSPNTNETDQSSLLQLREMYKRYMLNSVVAQWLLERHAQTDFQVVRKEKSILISISSESSPEVIPSYAPSVPFPSSEDLMFLDRHHHGFALGHIWGNIYSETHPYSALAKRVNKCGWEKVQSRKFASDLTVKGVLESVEYTWFTDDRAMVILSRVPLESNQQFVRVSEVLFFGPTTRVDIPPQRPELVLRVNDRAYCISCREDFCICTNSNVEPFSPMTLIKQSSDISTAGGGEVECTVRSWKDRATAVSKGTKTGLLTIIYSNTVSGEQSNITVRQTYTSTFLDQSEISNRIQFHLTRLLSRLPHANQTEQNQSLVNSGTTSCPPGFCGPNTSNTGLNGVLAGQSPQNFLPKISSWSDPTKPTHDSPSQTQIANSSPTKQGCCSKPSDPQCGTSPTPTSTRSDGRPASVLGNPSSGLVLRSIGSRASEGDSSSRDGMVLNSLCGPDKAGQECLCSAENMPDPALARILNSKRDVIAANDFPDIPVIEPILEPPGAPLNNVAGIPLQSPLTSVRQPGIHELREDDRGRMESLIGGVPFESQSPISTRCGASPMLPSPLPPPLLNQGEPPLKRPRSDNFALELDSAWPPHVDDRNMNLPSWNMANFTDRPSSTLGRAFGNTRSPSPLPMMSNVLKPLSPSTNVLSVNALSLGKPASAEGEFPHPNDSLPLINDALRTRRNDDITKGLPGLIKPLESVKPGQFLSSKTNDEGHFPTTGDNNNTNDVCCEVCGLSFAKKGNKIRHIQTVHDRLKQFKCDMCDTRFGLKADLNRHRLRIHISRAFACETCGKSFAEQSRLEHHVKVMHQQETRPFECDICHLRLSRKSSLVRHRQTVHDRTRFRCRFCENTYSQRFDAVRHERKEHAEHLESLENEIK